MKRKMREYDELKELVDEKNKIKKKANKKLLLDIEYHF